jgi:catechol 2,3-dioxygenase-like lactoylglutathione lyase family enzyme
MPKIARILETCLYVDDLEGAGQFYERCFELTPMYADARMRAYALGETVLLLFPRGQSLKPVVTPGGTIPPHDGSGPLHIAFAVDANELPVWEQRLKHAGIAIEGRMRWPRGGTSLYFRDPDGHLLEVATPGLWVNY